MTTSAAKAVSNPRTGQTTAFAVTAGLFAIWGITLWLYNALFNEFSKLFAFSPSQVAWTLSLFNIVYFVLAVPAALFHRQFGYKLGLLSGLSIISLGAFLLYLAIIQHSCVYFLGAVVMMGTCGAWLDTALNALAVEAGRSETSVVRLNFAHAFNGLGLLAGCLTARWLIETHYQLSTGATAQLSARPYVLVGLGAILLAFLIEQMNLPAFATSRAGKASHIREEIHPLLGDKGILFAAAALCAYSVVLTVIWSSNPHYGRLELPGHSVGLIEKGFFWFAIGRCVGTALMRWIDPIRLLQWCTGLGLIAVVMAAVLGGMSGWVCLISASLFLSIAFPTIFGIALGGRGLHIKLAAGFLATAAGIGNAVAPLFVTPAVQALNIRVVILLALPFLAVILFYALASHAAGLQIRAAGKHGHHPSIG
jgi:MFS transporter, FHS family, L-fucose permease